MKKLIIILSIIIISVFFQCIERFPWWTFTIPIFILGAILPGKKWRVLPFLCGFVAGFISWVGALLYFENNFEGEIITDISQIFEMSPVMVYLIVGLIGGVLCGLAFYAGCLLRKGREPLTLEI